jgi:hypothetical protein
MSHQTRRQRPNKNTSAFKCVHSRPVEPRLIVSLQAVQELPATKHGTTSTEVEMFHQLGHLRHSLANTEIRRATDRSTLTERRPSRDLAINTEPKITYSKDVGDFDVRRQLVEHDERSWQSYLHQPVTSERALQTELFDTKRDVGYIDDALVEEQRQEILTFRLPLKHVTTEEIYETTVTTENKQSHREVEELHKRVAAEQSYAHERVIPIDVSECRSRSAPEELIEECYEVVSTVSQPLASTSVQRYADLCTTTLDSHEDLTSFHDEWTLSEGQRPLETTMIDR